MVILGEKMSKSEAFSDNNFSLKMTPVSVLDTVIYVTRKYPLRGYFLGVLAHKTALDRLWRSDEPLNCVEYT